MNKFKIALIGECMIELQEIEAEVIQQTFGGDTLNTAIYMARLGRSLPIQVDYVTALGTDPFSDAMIAFWEKESVGSSMIQRINGKRPGLYFIKLDENGERFFHYWRGEAAARQCFEYPGSELVLARLNDYDGVYLSGISLAILEPNSLSRLFDCLREIHAQGKAIFFDCNYRPHLWPSLEAAIHTYHQVFSFSHTVLLNMEEGASLLNQQTDTGIHETLSNIGVHESVIRNGSNPCSVACNGSIDRIPAEKVDQVIDTTAAGDSFSAAYLLARRFGHTIRDATLFAHRMAAYVIKHKGSIAPIEAMPFKGSMLLKDSLNFDE